MTRSRQTSTIEAHTTPTHTQRLIDGSLSGSILQSLSREQITTKLQEPGATPPCVRSRYALTEGYPELAYWGLIICLVSGPMISD